jgi:glycosyltransferase involved in cell wall biosynthesis
MRDNYKLSNIEVILKKKVLFVAHNLAGGGAEKLLISYLNALDKDKFDLSLCVLKNVGVYQNSIPYWIKTTYLFSAEQSNNFPRDLGTIKQLYKERIKDKYDYEIAFLEGPATAFVSSSYNVNSTKIAWVHINLYDYHWTSKYFSNVDEERNIFLCFNKIIIVSESARKGFESLFGKMPNLQVINNAIDKNGIKKKSMEFHIQKDSFTFCNISSLQPHKGHERLIKAFARLIHAGAEISLIILGVGEEKQKLMDLVHKLNIPDKVNFLGFIKNPYPYLLSSDVYVHSSFCEGYSLAICEALTLNKPIISTNCSGIVDSLNYGEYGLIVENSENGLYIGMKQTVEDAEFCKILQKKSIIGSKNLQFDYIIKTIENILT